MSEIRFKVSDDLPIEIIKFEMEKELNLKVNRLRRIRHAIKTLGLTAKDLDKFEAAREISWERTKKKHVL